MPVISISLDNEADDKLAKIAEEFDGNKSLAVRKIIREYKI